MKALQIKAYGGPEVMQIGELPEPDPKRGQVVVAIRAASVNPVDWKVRAGEMKFITGRTFPKTLGSDFAGVVERVGAGVKDPSVGARVYGITPVMMRKPGAHAERLAVACKRLRRMPDGMSFELAAALSVAGLTALKGLRECGDLHGKMVLINGGTGGVGHFAVQIAKARGATVTAVCSERNAGRARSFGADVVIDYRKERAPYSKMNPPTVTRGWEQIGSCRIFNTELGFANPLITRHHHQSDHTVIPITNAPANGTFLSQDRRMPLPKRCCHRKPGLILDNLHKALPLVN